MDERLLPGEAIDPDAPKQFLLVAQEVPVAGLYLDHLFLDQDAVPTLVETKRGKNREGRREVVAQMLDYAANAAVEWVPRERSHRSEHRADRARRRSLDLVDGAASATGAIQDP